MKAFASSAAIEAAPDVIWRILVDAPAYPSWNATVRRVDGVISLGATITIAVTSAQGRSFPVNVSVFDAPARMVWSSAMPLGLFRGERVFDLRPTAQGITTFSMSETYSGLLASLITKSIPDLQPAFDEFAACLKTRAERERA